MSADELALICPDRVVDPLDRTEEMKRLGEEALRQFALLHNDLVEVAGDRGGRRSDIVRRFALEHGASPQAAERYVSQWKLCRAARKAFDERLQAGEALERTALCARADELQAALQKADAHGLMAVLDFLLGIIMTAHDVTDPLELMKVFETPSRWNPEEWGLSVLAGLIATGRLSYEAALATPVLRKARKAIGLETPRAQAKAKRQPKSEPTSEPKPELKPEIKPAADVKEAVQKAVGDEDRPLPGGISCADVFRERPITAAEVTSVLNRMGKRHKRYFAWMHNRLAAIIRRCFGKRPADVKAALPFAESDPAAAARIERQWQEILVIRDAMEPMARVLHPSPEEEQRYAPEAAMLYHRPENAPAQQLLAQLLCLASLAMNFESPLDIEWEFRQGRAEDPEGDTEFAVHCAMIASGCLNRLRPRKCWEEASGEDEEDDEADDSVTDEEFKRLLKNAERWRDTFFLKLPKPQLVFFMLALGGMVPALEWFHHHLDVADRVAKKAGLPDSMESNLRLATGHIAMLIATLKEESGRLQRERVELPRPAPGQTNNDFVDSLADAVWDRSMTLFGIKANPLVQFVLMLNVPMFLLERITDRERNAIHETVQPPLHELFPVFVLFFERLCVRFGETMRQQVAEYCAEKEAAAASDNETVAASPDFFKNSTIAMRRR